MNFTDNCDIFSSLTEDGINRILSYIQRQRPSLFNYATADIAKTPGLLCKVIEHHKIVTDRNNPLVTIQKPLNIPGTLYGVSFAAQLMDLSIELHPGDRLSLPPELNPPLKEQRLAIEMKLCGGIGCPSEESVNQLYHQ
jgi:hypothetical protein